MTAAVAADSKAELAELLLRLWRIRVFETRVLELFEEKLVRGSAHPYIGMEAIAVGVCSALGTEDYITSTHRGHGHCIAKGLDMGRMMAEILGREAGYCRGKGGSMHITAMEHGMLGADAIVCGSAALGVGAAYGLSLRGRDAVVVVFFGDGASNQGIFHEAANLAAVLAAPVVFVCENNQWAISTSVQASTSVENIADRASGYGFPGVIADGNDVLEMQRVAAEAVSRARAGKGPTLIEAKSFRIGAHSAATKTDPRDEEILGPWRAKDPILRFTASLREGEGFTQERLDEIEAQARAEVEEAVRFALDSPAPEAEEAFEDVYAPAPWNATGTLA